MITSYRNMNNYEQAVIDRLLEIPFKGSHELKLQLDSCKVREFEKDKDSCDSLELKTQSKIKAKVKNRIPVEARFKSQDYPVDVLLHVIDGFVNELEFVYYNKVKKPNPKDLVVSVNEI